MKALVIALLFCGAATLFGILSGCATAGRTDASAQPATSLVWPPQPDAPRIAFVQTIGQPADVGVKRSGFGRFANWLTGSVKGKEPLIKPFGVAFDENDNLCVTDTGANAICFFDRQKTKWSRWEKLGKFRFESPVAVAKQKGIFYVADSGLASIIAFDERGRLLFETTNQLQRPSGLAISSERLFATDSKRHCVVVFNLAGKFISEFGKRGTGAGEFNFPTHIAADAGGNLFVTDSINSRVQMFDAGGNFKKEIGSIGDAPGHFSRPKGVAADAFGHVYVIDGMFDNIQIFDREGRFLLNLGETGTGAGQFWLPNGIAISRQNEIFIADSYNRRIQVFKYVGTE